MALPIVRGHREEQLSPAPPVFAPVWELEELRHARGSADGEHVARHQPRTRAGAPTADVR